MENLQAPTFLDGRYRLDRLVAARDDVTIWDATDLARDRSVRLSIFERGAAVVHQGMTEDGTFVAIDDEASPFEPEEIEPAPRRRRVWPLAVAGLACALIGVAGFHFMTNRSSDAASETTTITAAQVPAPIATTAPAPTIVEPPVVATPVAAPEHHETRATKAKPRAVKSTASKAKVASANYDPLTI